MSTPEQSKSSPVDLWKYVKRIFWASVAVAILGFALDDWAKLQAGRNAYVVQRCFAATEIESWDKLDSARKIDDSYGVQELMSHGNILELQPYTSLLVLESEINWRGVSDSQFRRRVRILSGIHEGKAAWLPDKFMMPATPVPIEKTPP